MSRRSFFDHGNYKHGHRTSYKVYRLLEGMDEVRLDKDYIWYKGDTSHFYITNVKCSDPYGIVKVIIRSANERNSTKYGRYKLFNSSKDKYSPRYGGSRSSGKIGWGWYKERESKDETNRKFALVDNVPETIVKNILEDVNFGPKPKKPKHKNSGSMSAAGGHPVRQYFLRRSKEEKRKNNRKNISLSADIS